MTEKVKPWTRWPIILWLTLVWVLVWGDLTWANVINGLVLGTLVVTVAPMPRVGFDGRPWLPGILTLLGRFLVDVVVASVQIAAAALNFGHQPRAAVVRVQLRSHSDLLLTLTAQICSLVPGSIIVEAHRHTGTLYLHVFDVDRVGGIDEARRIVLEIERRVLIAIATDAEIAEAGLPPRRRLLGRRKVTS